MELFKYSLIHHIQIHLTVALLTTLQNIMEEHYILCKIQFTHILLTVYFIIIQVKMEEHYMYCKIQFTHFRLIVCFITIPRKVEAQCLLKIIQHIWIHPTACLFIIKLIQKAEHYLLLIVQTIQILSTVFFSKIKQLLEELCLYSIIHHIQIHLTVFLQITVQNCKEGRYI